jgi:hypothetical protein
MVVWLVDMIDVPQRRPAHLLMATARPGHRQESGSTPLPRRDRTAMP